MDETFTSTGDCGRRTARSQAPRSVGEPPLSFEEGSTMRFNHRVLAVSVALLLVLMAAAAASGSASKGGSASSKPRITFAEILFSVPGLDYLGQFDKGT